MSAHDPPTALSSQEGRACSVLTVDPAPANLFGERYPPKPIDAGSGPCLVSAASRVAAVVVLLEVGDGVTPDDNTGFTGARRFIAFPRALSAVRIRRCWPGDKKGAQHTGTHYMRVTSPPRHSQCTLPVRINLRPSSTFSSCSALPLRYVSKPSMPIFFNTLPTTRKNVQAAKICKA